MARPRDPGSGLERDRTAGPRRATDHGARRQGGPDARRRGTECESGHRERDARRRCVRAESANPSHFTQSRGSRAHVPYYSLYTPHPAPAPDAMALRALAPWRATRRDGGERAPHASKRGKTTVIWRPRSAHPATALNARRACALAHGPAVQPAWRPLPAVTLLRRRCDVQLGNNVRPAAGARNARCTLAVSATAASAARAGSGGGRVGTVRSA